MNKGISRQKWLIGPTDRGKLVRNKTSSCINNWRTR